MSKLNFKLFSKINFSVHNPILLIEACCIQSDFYVNYDIIRNKNISYVNKIGGRINENVLKKCSEVINDSAVKITSYTLDSFQELENKEKKELVKELDTKIVKKLLSIKGIRLSKVTKILHTLFPEICPMIDNPLQQIYKQQINNSWKAESLEELLIQFYENLANVENKDNINRLHRELTHLKLTKIRIFDIIWWSYLKSLDPKRKGISWKIFNKMKAAKPSDWKTEVLPSKRTTIRLDRTFSLQEMKRICRGLVPEQMEDKWFIYWKDDTLFLHRSWTGFCIYVVRFFAESDRYRMIEAHVNRDPEQYNETSDERDAEMISYLVDALLLHQEAVFPSDEPSSQKQSLMNCSQVGRAMLDQHPNDE